MSALEVARQIWDANSLADSAKDQVHDRAMEMLEVLATRGLIQQNGPLKLETLFTPVGGAMSEETAKPRKRSKKNPAAEEYYEDVDNSDPKPPKAPKRKKKRAPVSEKPAAEKLPPAPKPKPKTRGRTITMEQAIQIEELANRQRELTLRLADSAVTRKAAAAIFNEAVKEYAAAARHLRDGEGSKSGFFAAMDRKDDAERKQIESYASHRELRAEIDKVNEKLSQAGKEELPLFEAEDGGPIDPG